MLRGVHVVPRKSVTLSNTTICRSKVTLFTHTNRFYSEEKPKFKVEGVVSEMTTFPPKINQMVDDYVNLNVAEQMMFFRLLCQRLNVDFYTALQGRRGSHDLANAPAPTAAPTAPAAQAAAPGAKDAKKEAAKKEEKKEEKSTVTIKLVKLADGAKYKVLKEIRTLKPGMSVADSKNFVENLPSVLAEGVSKEEAAKWEQKIKEAGGELAME